MIEIFLVLYCADFNVKIRPDSIRFACNNEMWFNTFSHECACFLS